MKDVVIKILSGTLVLWVMICFSVGAIKYFNKPLLGLSNVERTAYGINREIPMADDVDLRIDKINEGEFFGSAVLTLRTKEAKEAYKKSERSNVVITGVHAKCWMPQVPNWLDLKEVKRVNGNPILSTSKKSEIYSSGDDFYYPFDSYLVGVSFDIQLYYGDGYERFEKSADSASVFFDLPRGFIVEELDKIPNSSCEYQELYLGKVNNSELLHKIYRSPWVKFFVLGLLALIFAPIILLMRASVDSLNIDLLASIVSIFAVRAFIFGDSTKFHALDFVFCVSAILVVVIPMMKVILKKNGAGDPESSSWF